jgi:GNAT superfamily N-acetyltransferase
MGIRRFRADDADNVSHIIRRCLLEVNIKDYPKELIEHMYDYFSPGNLVEISARRRMYVFVQDNEIQGAGSLRDNNVRSVFVNPEFPNLGIGRELMKHFEKLVKRSGYKTIELFSSVSAFGFYRKLGYKRIRTVQDKDTGKNIVMRKRL